MNESFRLFPEAASTNAGRIDALYLFLCGMTIFFTVGIFLTILYLGLKYRRRKGVLPTQIHTNLALELGWTIVPLIIVMVIFVWSATLYVQVQRPPKGAMEINVIARQWMWQIQHPTGKRENNELHVPTGRPIKLIMTSQDVIHSFYIPAFRIKQDVLPSGYSTEWFQATKTGTYHLFCAEYCGAQHSGMIGSVIVMEPNDYQAWLAGTEGDRSTVVPEEAEPTAVGKALFTRYGCITCHGIRAPSLAGLFGSRQKLADGRIVLADENYIRNSILHPSDDMVAGYPPIMPSFVAQLSEEQVMQLVTYIKGLKDAKATTTNSP